MSDLFAGVARALAPGGRFFIITADDSLRTVLKPNIYAQPLYGQLVTAWSDLIKRGNSTINRELRWMAAVPGLLKDVALSFVACHVVTVRLVFT